MLSFSFFCLCANTWASLIGRADLCYDGMSPERQPPETKLPLSGGLANTSPYAITKTPPPYNSSNCLIALGPNNQQHPATTTTFGYIWANSPNQISTCCLQAAFPVKLNVLPRCQNQRSNGRCEHSPLDDFEIQNQADFWNLNDQIIEDSPKQNSIKYAMRSTEMAINCTNVCCNMLYLCRGGWSATQDVFSNMSILARQCLIVKNVCTTLKEWRSLNWHSSKCRTAQDLKNIKSCQCTHILHKHHVSTTTSALLKWNQTSR